MTVHNPNMCPGCDLPIPSSHCWIAGCIDCPCEMPPYVPAAVTSSRCLRVRLAMLRAIGLGDR